MRACLCNCGQVLDNSLFLMLDALDDDRPTVRLVPMCFT